MKQIKIILLFILLAGVLSTCKKYPDDEKWIHLNKPEKRLTNKWSLFQVRNYMLNIIIPSGTPCGSGNEDINFHTDGEFAGDASYIHYSGTWNFFDHKKKIKITEVNNMTHEFTILQLEKDHLKLRGDSLEFTFKEYCGN